MQIEYLTRGQIAQQGMLYFASKQPRHFWHQERLHPIQSVFIQMASERTV